MVRNLTVHPRIRISHRFIRIRILRVLWTRIISAIIACVIAQRMWSKKKTTKTKNWIHFVVSSRGPPTRARDQDIHLEKWFFSRSLSYQLLFAVGIDLTTKCTRSNRIVCHFSVVSSFSSTINLMAHNYIFNGSSSLHLVSRRCHDFWQNCMWSGHWIANVCCANSSSEWVVCHSHTYLEMFIVSQHIY